MKKIYWLYYTFPRQCFETYSVLGITYICYSDDPTLMYKHSSKYNRLASEMADMFSVKCKDGIKRHSFETFNSLEELKLTAAIRNWDLRKGEEVFGKGISNSRQVEYKLKNL